MFTIRRSSPLARTAVVYITIGALTDVWSAIWFWYLSNNPPSSYTAFYWCYGVLFTGFTLVLIGLTIGRIGRSARHAVLPAEKVTATLTQPEQTAAAKAPIIDRRGEPGGNADAGAE